MMWLEHNQRMLRVLDGDTFSLCLFAQCVALVFGSHWLTSAVLTNCWGEGVGMSRKLFVLEGAIFGYFMCILHSPA